MQTRRSFPGAYTSLHERLLAPFPPSPQRLAYTSCTTQTQIGCLAGGHQSLRQPLIPQAARMYLHLDHIVRSVVEVVQGSSLTTAKTTLSASLCLPDPQAHTHSTDPHPLTHQSPQATTSQPRRHPLIMHLKLPLFSHFRLRLTGRLPHRTSLTDGQRKMTQAITSLANSSSGCTARSRSSKLEYSRRMAMTRMMA